eukprot:2286741-Amphidinium_carterae.1
MDAFKAGRESVESTSLGSKSQTLKTFKPLKLGNLQRLPNTLDTKPLEVIKALIEVRNNRD